MNKRIVFFDIDGTLIDDDTHLIPESAVDAIHKAQKNGHILIINTGRPNIALDQSLKDIGFDGYICACGTYIEYNGEVIFHASMKEKERKDVLSKIFEYDLEGVVEGPEGIFFTKGGTHRFHRVSYEYYKQHKFPIYTFTNGDIVPFDKFIVLHRDDQDIRPFKEFAQKEYTIIQRDTTFLELVPKAYSKATGIQFLLDYLNIPLEQTISIGDSTNDLPMLSYTKESVAMGNANPVLFDSVTYITTDINEDGIANALKHFGLI
jgi:Cof subfamily protein (haloacid dehalogenase superfamily)